MDIQLTDKIIGWNVDSAGLLAWIAFAWRDRNTRTWYEQKWPIPQPINSDVYFAPLVFSDHRRSNDTAIPGAMLFADLDGASPFDQTIEPSIAWETSPGSYQAVWLMNKPPLTYRGWADLNQRMTYYTGADKGGWMGSKLLRVPGSVNWKRYDKETASAPVGRVLWKKWNLIYTPNEMESNLPHLPTPSPTDTGEDMPDTPTYHEWGIFLGEVWKDIPLSVRAMLVKEAVDDRSMAIYRTLKLMKEGGISEGDAFRLIYWVPWNKFQSRPWQLWKEIKRAYAN